MPLLGFDGNFCWQVQSYGLEKKPMIQYFGVVESKYLLNRVMNNPQK